MGVTTTLWIARGATTTPGVGPTLDAEDGAMVIRSATGATGCGSAGAVVSGVPGGTTSIVLVDSGDRRGGDVPLGERERLR